MKQSRSNSSPRTNLSKAAEIRNFVSGLQPLSSAEKLSSLSPSQREAQLSRQYLNSMLRDKKEQVNIQKVEKIEQTTDRLL